MTEAEKIEIEKNIANGNLTQIEIIQLMLHNAQHMATREEVKQDISKVETTLKQEISKLDDKISKVETTLRQEISKLDDKISKVETTLRQEISKLDDKISKVETNLKQDMKELRTELKQDISNVGAKFDKIQWLIVVTIVAIFSKDYILSLLQITP